MNYTKKYFFCVTARCFFDIFYKDGFQFLSCDDVEFARGPKRTWLRTMDEKT